MQISRLTLNENGIDCNEKDNSERCSDVNMSVVLGQLLYDPLLLASLSVVHLSQLCPTRGPHAAQFRFSL